MKWLRISYWVGAVADGIAALLMLSQAVLGVSSSLNEYVPEVPYRFAMGQAGALMVGWTILLLWADRDPLARRGVLLLTNVVVVGLMASMLGASAVGFMPLSSALPVILFQAGILVLFTSSYLISRREQE